MVKQHDKNQFTKKEFILAYSPMGKVPNGGEAWQQLARALKAGPLVTYSFQQGVTSYIAFITSKIVPSNGDGYSNM